MKTILAKVQIQFDQYSDGDSELYAMETIDKINEVIQREFPDISPIIFGNNIDSSDIEISVETEFEIDDDVEVPDPDDEFDSPAHGFVGRIIDIKGEYAEVEDQDGDVFTVELSRLTKV